MKFTKVKFLQNGAGYGFAYVKGQEGEILTEKVDKAIEKGIVERLDAPKPVPKKRTYKKK